MQRSVRGNKVYGPPPFRPFRSFVARVREENVVIQLVKERKKEIRGRRYEYHDNLNLESMKSVSLAQQALLCYSSALLHAVGLHTTMHLVQCFRDSLWCICIDELGQCVGDFRHSVKTKPSDHPVKMIFFIHRADRRLLIKNCIIIWLFIL